MHPSCGPTTSTNHYGPLPLSTPRGFYNQSPRQHSRLVPIEVFCGTTLHCSYLQHAKVWGWPAYVLGPHLQDGKKIPKWEPRARRGQFLGFSRKHSSLVGLIWNLQTQYITPQFHIVYKELFSTVASDHVLDLSEVWIDLFRDSRENYLEGYDDGRDKDLPELHNDWPTDENKPCERHKKIIKTATAVITYLRHQL
jgi:hypothetical protein